MKTILTRLIKTIQTTAATLIRKLLQGLGFGEKYQTIIVNAGGVIPCVGEIVEGVALVDESALVGVSTPAMLSSEKGRNQVVKGTVVVEGTLTIKYNPAAQLP